MSGFRRQICSFRIILFGIVIVFSSHLTICATSQKIVLERIVLNGDSVISLNSSGAQKLLNDNKMLVLSKRTNNILFEVSYNQDTEYQFLLKGYDKVWSEWRKANFKEYTNLRAGEYALNVRTKGGANNIQEYSLIPVKILPAWYFSSPFISGIAVLILLIVWTLYDQLNLRFARRQYKLEQIINERTEELVIEKDKTETLLANLLPKNTADELMAKGKATKIKYNFVTVLFSDIQGFTKIAEEMNPEVLIDELDKFFFTFDSVVEKFGIEKIKTIGDAYMCAGGIPEKNRTNPVEVILAALEMRAYMSRLKESSELEGMKYWDIRIGIHTGTVVAGVVGQKKLSYDIWGDTVNTASRMESSGEAGKINISGTTYEFVKDFFTCEYRGKMPVKYKGELEMYFVSGIIPELSDENGNPNKKFVAKMELIKLEDIEEIIVKMFESEATQKLFFHNSSMFKTICDQVDLLARAENLSDEEFIYLKLAAIFLLTGYISDYFKPLEGAMNHMEDILPKHGFNQESIEATKRIIKNSFSDHIESIQDKILHDAKYDYMGRVDYSSLTDKLRKENAEHGKLYDDATWTEMQTRLLYNHVFLTSTAQMLRNVSVESQAAALSSKDA